MEMAPYLLLGFFVAGVMHVYLPQGTFNRWFGKKNLKSVIMASLMGIPLPLCSCGVIPTGISLYKDGASKGSTVSFLISTPQTGVDSIMVTYSLLGLPFAIIRPIIALITGVFGGMLENATDSKEQSTENKSSELTSEKSSQGKKSPIEVIKYAFGEFLEDITDWLLIGIMLAGVISVLIPQDFFDSIYFKNEILSMLIVLVASIPFYVCATGSVPIAAALLLKGLNPGAVLVFLMAGPATNIATMTVISQAMGKKTMLVYLSSIVLGSLVFGMMINTLFPSDFFNISAIHMDHHNNPLMWWIKILSVVFLGFLMLRIYMLKLNRWMNRKKGQKLVSNQTMKIEVHGMSCENCKVKVESNLIELDQINESIADLSQKTVELKGNNIDLNEVKAAIENSGYKFEKLLSNEN